MTGNRKGFTLIELLVVIAIIGILSSIVMSSLGVARGKGGDAKVKAQLSGLRAAAEIYYDSNGGYGSATDDCSAGMFTDTASGISQYADQANYPVGSTLSCHSSGSAYAVSALLTASSTAAWCVDSSGDSRQIESNLSDGDTDC